MDNHVCRLSMLIYHSFLKKKKRVSIHCFNTASHNGTERGSNGKMRRGATRTASSVNSVRSLVGGLISNELWDYAVACWCGIKLVNCAFSNCTWAQSHWTVISRAPTVILALYKNLKLRSIFNLPLTHFARGQLLKLQTRLDQHIWFLPLCICMPKQQKRMFFSVVWRSGAAPGTR